MQHITMGPPCFSHPKINKRGWMERWTVHARGWARRGDTTGRALGARSFPRGLRALRAEAAHNVPSVRSIYIYITGPRHVAAPIRLTSLGSKESFCWEFIHSHSKAMIRGCMATAFNRRTRRPRGAVKDDLGQLCLKDCVSKYQRCI